MTAASSWSSTSPACSSTRRSASLRDVAPSAGLDGRQAGAGGCGARPNRGRPTSGRPVHLAPSRHKSAEIYGFEPEETVFVQQCATVKSSKTVCHTDKETVPLNEEGEGTVQMTVRRVFVAHNEDGASAGEVDCAVADCSVVVGNSEGGSAASISFRS
ncbi:neocarzinostatin apoprotein domain-containing protein [Streptomyces sp. NPDC051211]|uniref:neocarzinostatin apoprotein domain-containing protein n=1 Tax=Streptomyces sp. NPDC051211 TaxID=3154643 RepID=UPI00344E6C96